MKKEKRKTFFQIIHYIVLEKYCIQENVYLFKDYQYSDQCQIVTDLRARREILNKNRLCFKCLKYGHTKPNCSIKCYKFKKEEDNLTALCNPNKANDNPTEEEITCLVKKYI